MTKIYPNTDLVNRLRENGYNVKNLWEVPGPEGTMIAFMNGYSIRGRVFIVQTYRGGGFEVYTSSNEIFPDKILEKFEEWLKG